MSKRQTPNSSSRTNTKLVHKHPKCNISSVEISGLTDDKEVIVETIVTEEADNNKIDRKLYMFETKTTDNTALNRFQEGIDKETQD